MDSDFLQFFLHFHFITTSLRAVNEMTMILRPNSVC